MSNRLLFHIAYYMTDKKRIDSKNKIDKSKPEFNNHVLDGVCSFLKEINDYEGFSYKKVVLDILKMIQLFLTKLYNFYVII